jgi:hypothetical protein
MHTPVKKFFIIVGAWGLAAAAAGSSGLLTRLPPPVMPLIVFGATFTLMAGLPANRWLGAALGSIGTRGILALNLGRFIGLAFLWMQSRGRLPAEFAQRAGWGDVATAAGALVLLFWRDGAAFRRLLVAWNVLGLLDLLVAVGTAASLALGRPDSMEAMTRLPFCLIPFWIVPLLLAMHVFLLLRAFRGSVGADGPAASVAA